MRLVEVVVLVGSQCVSPLQHAPNHTVAFQVPCAVLIERDGESGGIGVKPVAQAHDPRVVRALKRYGAMAAAPPPEAAAPRASLTEAAPEAAPTPAAPEKTNEKLTETVEDTAPQASDAAEDASEAVAVVDETPEAAADPPPEAETKKASTGTSKKKKTKSKRTSQCKGKTKPKWYTNAQGRRKYRCVAGGSLPVY